MSVALRGRGLNRLASLLLVLFAAVAGTAEARDLYPKKGDSDPHDGVAAARRHAVQGIDVSHYQLEIDWRRVKGAGARFAFIKATEGGDLLDPRFRDNWAGAKAAGVPRGAYHFVFWCRPARDQIRWFLRHVPKDPDALPPVLDVEWSHKTGCPRPSPEKARAKMREMLKAFHAHYGRKPVIYTDINFHEDVLSGTTEFDDYPFWVRSVADKPQERYENRPWEFWQFTATGRVPGIVGDVDRNAFFGSEKQFRDWVEGRFDIGTRRMLKDEKPPGAPSTLQAFAPPVPSGRFLPPSRAAALTADEEIAIAPPIPPRPAERMRRRDPSRPTPPAAVPDVTGSLRR